MLKIAILFTPCHALTMFTLVSSEKHALTLPATGNIADAIDIAQNETVNAQRV